jgi:hypothetical protein
MQGSGYLDVLKERYRFQDWKDGGVGAAPQETQGFSFGGSELPGWRLARQARRAADVPGMRSLVRTTWEGRSPDQLLGIDLYECESPAAARETLLRVLGEFQGPTLNPVSGIGDVAFGTPGDTAIVFVRGSTVAAVRNAGRRVEALGDIARALDALLSPGDKRRSSRRSP